MHIDISLFIKNMRIHSNAVSSNHVKKEKRKIKQPAPDLV